MIELDSPVLVELIEAFVALAASVEVAEAAVETASGRMASRCDGVTQPAALDEQVTFSLELSLDSVQAVQSGL